MNSEIARVPASVDKNPFDLIIVGGGINGCGIARDAALRGLRVLLLEKSGIGSGTTSWSTRLIHGGLRYLEHYEVSLVRESLREREILLRIAPHLVRPLPFLIPIYKGEKRSPALIRMGMVSYDLLSFGKSLERHHMLSREEALREEPGLEPDGLLGAARYYDAQVQYPERLALENVLDARDNGATILTHARVDGFLWDGNAVTGVQFTDLLEGTGHSARAAITINATGPWLDALMQEADDTSPRPMIGGTKGSHIVVRSFPGAPHEALYVEARENGRPYFIVPWNGLYLIGTTDFRYAGDLDRIVASEEEIDYLVRETNTVIRGAGLGRGSVLYTYSGVRPLPQVEEGVEGDITRKHIIRDHSPQIEGLVSIIGGKLTTYRNLARQTVSLVYRKLGRRPVPSATGRIPLPGARVLDYAAFEARFRDESGQPSHVVNHLLSVYGTRANGVLETAHGSNGLLSQFSESGAIGAEVPFALDHEMAITLEDVLMRCTMVGWGGDVGVGPDELAAKLAIRHSGWTDEKGREQVLAYRRYIERYTPKVLASM
ncbi:MAG: glycerol-3-phosphate dehydrogenase [Chloroflexota bacterium]